MKKVMLFIISLLAFPLISNADNKCSSENIDMQRKYLYNVNVTYSVQIKNNKAEYTITLANLTDNMVVTGTDLKAKGKSDFKNGTLVFTTTKSGNYNINIYSKECISNIIDISKSISLPKYNPYYSNKLCEGLESYYQCQKWSVYSADSKKFEKDIKQIKEKKNVKVEDNNEENKDTTTKWYQNVRNIVVKYWWGFVILVLIIIGIYYMIRAKEKKNSFDFNV